MQGHPGGPDVGLPAFKSTGTQVSLGCFHGQRGGICQEEGKSSQRVSKGRSGQPGGGLHPYGLMWGEKGALTWWQQGDAAAAAASPGQLAVQTMGGCHPAQAVQGRMADPDDIQMVLVYIKQFLKAIADTGDEHAR